MVFDAVAVVFPHRGGSAEPARGAEGDCDHHHRGPERGADLRHPRGAAPAHPLEAQRRAAQLPRPGGHQRTS